MDRFGEADLVRRLVSQRYIDLWLGKLVGGSCQCLDVVAREVDCLSGNYNPFFVLKVLILSTRVISLGTQLYFEIAIR